MSGLRVLVTGSRQWTDRQAVDGALLECWHEALQVGAAGITVVHGACPTGADAMAAAWAFRHGVEAEGWVAEWASLGRAAGPLRNERMVRAGAQVCLAFPLGRSSGTWDCARRAELAGIEVRVVKL